MKHLPSIIAAAIPVALSLCASASWAKTEIQFIKSDNFVDIGNRISIRDGEETLKRVAAALTERADAVLAPGQDMKIEVQDIDLAGDPHPLGGRMDMIRVIKPLYRPAMKFSYAVTQDGKTVREGRAELQDMGFMDHFNRYFRDDPLYYEKPMLDKWFEEQFGKPVKVSRR